MTSTCVICEASFTVYDPARPPKTCSPTCAGRLATFKRKPGVTYRRYLLADHPLANSTGYVLTHRVVLYDKIGPGTHPCHWCGTPVTWQRGGTQRGRLMADHVDGNILNNAPENLVPSCLSCNANRDHPATIREGEVYGLTGDGKRFRAAKRACQHCGTAFAARPTGTARYCSKQCSTRAMVKPNAIQGGELTVQLPSGARTRAIERECAKCGRRFLAQPRRLKEGRGIYCSRSCIRRTSASGHTRP